MRTAKSTIPAPSHTARAKFASEIVLVNGWGHLFGLGPVDLEDDRVALPESVERQVAKVFSNLDKLLAKAGLTRDNIVAVRVHLTNYDTLYKRMNTAYLAAFPAAPPPARSCIGVSHLTRGAQVEMDFVLCQ